MTATSHAVTGAAVAAVVRQPLLVLPLALASHFVCDALPHFGINMKFGSKSMYSWLAVDGAVAVAVALLLLAVGVTQPWLLAMGGFVAMSPDLMWLWHGLKKSKPDTYGVITSLHHSIQWYQKPAGIVVDIAWTTICLVIILRFAVAA